MLTFSYPSIHLLSLWINCFSFHHFLHLHHQKYMWLNYSMWVECSFVLIFVFISNLLSLRASVLYWYSSQNKTFSFMKMKQSLPATGDITAYSLEVHSQTPWPFTVYIQLQWRDSENCISRCTCSIEVGFSHTFPHCKVMQSEILISLCSCFLFPVWVV